MIAFTYKEKTYLGGITLLNPVSGSAQIILDKYYSDSCNFIVLSASVQQLMENVSPHERFSFHVNSVLKCLFYFLVQTEFAAALTKSKCIINN